MIGFIAGLIVSPGAITLQVGQQVVTGVLEFRTVQAQPHQPHPEGKQFVVAVGLAHHRAALGDGLGGHGQAQVDISRRPARVEGGVEAAEFHRAPEKTE